MKDYYVQADGPFYGAHHYGIDDETLLRIIKNRIEEGFKTLKIEDITKVVPSAYYGPLAAPSNE